MLSQYAFDEKYGVYARSGRPEFRYSDSQEVEERIWRIIDTAHDRSTASRELLAGITDWPSLYHLSPYRANLLRPFAPLIRGSVLEIGSGCGALTRFLAEQTASIVGVEGSMRRASIAAARCAGLPNVRIYCDNFQEFAAEQQFQLVACVGVIEYSPLYFEDSDPFGTMLRRMASFVAPDGCLLIAIENRLGLKYFAGAPEDHTGDPFQSIEDRYSRSTPLTLGRREWQESLRNAGLELVSAWYPFPDYKLPRLLVSSDAPGQEWLNLGGLIRAQQAPDRGRSYERVFSEAMVWPALVKNGLVEDLANSFLLLARPAGARHPAWTPPALAYHYSVQRLPEYAVEVSISGPAESPRVCRRRVYSLEPQPSPYLHRVADERYLPGEVYSERMYRVLNSDGWTLEQLAEWAGPWVDYLRAATHAGPNGEPVLDGEYLDCVPLNLVASDGGFAAFDLEFIAEEPLSLPYVVFRGLFATLGWTGTCARPAGALPAGVAEIAFQVMARLRLPASAEQQEEFLLQEARLQGVIRGVPVEHAIRELRLATLQFRRRPGAPSLLERPALEMQLFWASAHGRYFREEDSCCQRTSASAERRVVHLSVPPGLPPTAQFRFDPANQPGLARIFAMRLIDSAGDAVWEWNGEPAALQTAVRDDIEIWATSDIGEAVFHFTTSDPRLSLPIPESALTSLHGGAVFEVDFRWLGVVTPPEP